MFIEFFDWFCNSLGTVFDTMKSFTLFDGFTFYNLAIAIFAIPIIIKLIHFMMGIEDEEPFLGQPQSDSYMSRYDDYKPRYSKRKRGRF